MKSPSFQWYPTDYLGSQRVQMMTLEQEGAYCRLLWYCWQHGSIPADPEQAAKLIGKGASTTLAESVLVMFKKSHRTGRLVHDRLEHEKHKQEAWRQKSSEGGRKSAQKRLKGGSTTVGRVVEKCLQPNANIPTPSPYPVLHEREHGDEHFKEANGYPTLAEVKDKAVFIGLAEWKAVDWFNEMQGCGWLDYNHRPIQDWTAVLTRVRTKWESDGRPMSPPKPKVVTSGNGKPLTPLDYKTIIQAKETQATAIKNRFCSETACDRVWADESKRQEYATLRKEIKDLTAKLGAYAT